jgi:formate dehydrogenase maturation protein FdhE
VSAPHPDRWKRSHCPFCGVGAAAAVARVGSGRTLLCVLCGGRWETAETICPGCLETNLDRFRILAARELGPATLESCLSCGTTLKVFSSPDLLWGPPLAMEVLTIRLDIVAARDEGIRRDAVACAALHPPR